MPGPGDLIRILDLLDADEEGPDPPSQEALHRRDRAIATARATASAPSSANNHPGAAQVEQVIAWMHSRGQAHPVAPGAAAAGVASSVCLAAGAFAGTAAAVGAFFYDGGARVNVLLLLAVFVLLPVAGIVAFAAAAALAGRDGPGPMAGRLARWLVQKVPARGIRPLAELASGRAGGGVARWLMLGWSQWLGLGFGAGAAATAMLLVLFTDLAFGWATTLDLAPARIAAAAEALALPWRHVLPAAVPDTALVEASRFFRLRDATAPAVDPALLGRWWPFVILCMTCYGVVPRVATTALCAWRLRAACRQSLLADPRVHALLDRMQTPWLESQSPQPETALEPAPVSASAADLPLAAGWQVVNWSAVPAPDATLAAVVGATTATVHAAGGLRSTSQDRDLIAALTTRLSQPDNGEGVVVIARAWEPPTLDLMDFLTGLRGALPVARPLALLPVAVAGERPAPATATQLGTWRQTLGRGAPESVVLVRLGGEPC